MQSWNRYSWINLAGSEAILAPIYRNCGKMANLARISAFTSAIPAGGALGPLMF
jgi:hypothetical protein